MLVVVGSRHDEAARNIVAAWASHGAALLTCEDLSAAGWQHTPSDASQSRAVVGGGVVSGGDIRCVFVRRPWVLEQELPHVVAADREFVAAELNAFLVSWLSQLRCRVLNRPSGTCLNGPNWRPQQWVHAAARAGMPVAPVRLRIPARRTTPVAPERAGRLRALTVVGNRCLGAPDEAWAARALQLAALARVELLGISITASPNDARFVSATAMPSMGDPDVADAACRLLLSS